jgi:hypothetical protein
MLRSGGGFYTGLTSTHKDYTMKKLLLAGAFAAVFSGGASAAVDNIVLVHGAYADGSCWNEVIALLQRQGSM